MYHSYFKYLIFRMLIQKYSILYYIYIYKDFKYLGSWINSSEKYIKVSMQTLWKSKTNLPLKRRLFVATVESVLLYGSESWTLNVKQQNSLDGTYTRMLRKALNVKWQEHVTNKEVYGKLLLVSSKIKDRRMKMLGHCVRHPELSVHPLILWEPSQGKASRGLRRISYVDMLKKYCGLHEKEEIRTSMMDRDVWRNLCHNDARVD